MAWSWSHTAEAYEYARKQVQAMEPEKLRVIWAEWEAKDDGSVAHLDEAKYTVALERAKEIPLDVLADAIWEKMEKQAICTNGGWEAWCCPFGCGPHMVPFGPEPEDS